MKGEREKGDGEWSRVQADCRADQLNRTDCTHAFTYVMYVRMYKHTYAAWASSTAVQAYLHRSPVCFSLVRSVQHPSDRQDESHLT